MQRVEDLLTLEGHSLPREITIFDPPPLRLKFTTHCSPISAFFRTRSAAISQEPRHKCTTFATFSSPPPTPSAVLAGLYNDFTSFSFGIPSPRLDGDEISRRNGLKVHAIGRYTEITISFRANLTRISQTRYCNLRRILWRWRYTKPAHTGCSTSISPRVSCGNTEYGGRRGNVELIANA